LQPLHKSWHPFLQPLHISWHPFGKSVWEKVAIRFHSILSIIVYLYFEITSANFKNKLMPINAKYIAEFEENGIYHIYNKTNNKELLFITDENRLFFLQKFSQILSPFLDVYCW
jgi:hypothetical protein